MNKKTSLLILTCVLTFSLVLALGTVTYSWYLSRISSDKEIEIPAAGYIVVGFDENPFVADEPLAPAVAMPNAIRDNQYIDVTKVYSESDSPISYVQTVATQYTHEDSIHFYEDPNDTTTELYSFVLTVQAYILDANGEEQYINTDNELRFNIIGDVDYIEENVTDEADINITPEVAFNIKGSAHIDLTITFWLALPDELCDPALISNQLYLKFGVAVTPIENVTP
ncbi:MAG: hypothetical protein IKA77_02050 [Clostridia bacterium]|nr:hypothetical protein [Clostridia bacterium]